ncbi:MAG TPA: glycosyltransferase family 2 protein [Armatimonadota bacterium]|jgi:glycosyltransferase involved in cell wall biosynthesis
MGVSILILTLNEEISLPNCLKSSAWSDDIVVFDSFSSDCTVDIARDFGARVYQRTFDNYSAHREAAHKMVSFKYPWVFSVDADERFTPELATEVNETIATCSDETSLFLVNRRDYLLGRWIRHSSCYPIWFERLFRPERVSMTDRIVNEHMVAEGRIARLKNPLIHYPFDKGVSHWIARHNRYSSMEAHEYLKQMDIGSLEWRALFCADPISRRLAIKNISCRLPFRPGLKFLYLYLYRRGIMDGASGFAYCMLQAIYEYMIELKVRELQRIQKGLSL